MIKRKDFTDKDGEIGIGWVGLGGDHKCLQCRTPMEMRVVMGSLDVDSEPGNFEGADERGYLSLCKNCLHLAWFDEDKQHLRELTLRERRDLKKDPAVWAEVVRQKEMIKKVRQEVEAVKRMMARLNN